MQRGILRSRVWADLGGELGDALPGVTAQRGARCRCRGPPFGSAGSACAAGVSGSLRIMCLFWGKHKRFVLSKRRTVLSRMPDCLNARRFQRPFCFPFWIALLWLRFPFPCAKIGAKEWAELGIEADLVYILKLTSGMSEVLPFSGHIISRLGFGLSWDIPPLSVSLLVVHSVEHSVLLLCKKSCSNQAKRSCR